MKNLILILFLSLPCICFSQDLIILKNGERIECAITRMDSTAIFYDYQKDDLTLSGSVPINEIRSYNLKSTGEDSNPNDDYLPPVEEVAPVKPSAITTETNRWVNMVTYSQRFGNNARGWSVQYYGYLSRSSSKWLLPIISEFETIELNTNYFARTGYNEFEMNYYSAGLTPFYRLYKTLYFNFGGNLIAGQEKLSKFNEATETRFFFGVAPTQGLYYISKTNFGIVVGIGVYEKLFTSKVYKSDLGVKLELGIKF